MPPMDHLPKILLTPGIRLVAIGIDERLRPFFKFISTRASLRELTVYVVTDRPATLLYDYSIYDSETRSLRTYVGPHGDPEQDHLQEINAL